MYTCIILYYYTLCTFQQMGVQAICSKEHISCSFRQIPRIFLFQLFKPFSNDLPTLKVIIDYKSGWDNTQPQKQKV